VHLVRKALDAMR